MNDSPLLFDGFGLFELLKIRLIITKFCIMTIKSVSNVCRLLALIMRHRALKQLNLQFLIEADDEIEQNYKFI